MRCGKQADSDNNRGRNHSQQSIIEQELTVMPLKIAIIGGNGNFFKNIKKNPKYEFETEGKGQRSTRNIEIYLEVQVLRSNFRKGKKLPKSTEKPTKTSKESISKQTTERC